MNGWGWVILGYGSLVAGVAGYVVMLGRRARSARRRLDAAE